ncbi:MAG: hypothetical protein ACI30K_00505 [Muribaculaceae bacterium]
MRNRFRLTKSELIGTAVILLGIAASIIVKELHQRATITRAQEIAIASDSITNVISTRSAAAKEADARNNQGKHKESRQGKGKGQGKVKANTTQITHTRNYLEDTIATAPRPQQTDRQD